MSDSLQGHNETKSEKQKEKTTSDYTKQDHRAKRQADSGLGETCAAGSQKLAAIAADDTARFIQAHMRKLRTARLH